MIRAEMNYIFVAILSLGCISRVAETGCLTYQFECLNGDCIPLKYHCNGMLDCFDSSDEFDCEGYKCLNSSVLCRNKAHCVPKHYLCDGMIDCMKDLSDEKNCVPDPVCFTNEFQCLNGECIKKRWRCDGKDDCKDSSDESDCETNQCDAGWSRCNSGSCVPSSYICDGAEDCRDGSDEENCVAATGCLRNQFQCLNGDCISMGGRCDGYSRCSDLSDEFNCEAYTCPNTSVRCGDTVKCVPKHFLCDGTPDCSGGWDEKNCTADPVCLKNEFQCLNGECILQMWHCDGKKDCKDSSDESNCETTQCDAGWLRCNTGSCSPPSYICDGQKFCSDGSDEKNCGTCENWGCSHFCAETSLKPQCHCPQGLELDPEDRRTCKVAATGCLRNQFQCLNGDCIALQQRCDGNSTCSDSSDESNCEAFTCPNTSVRCDNAAQCVPKHFLCDGREDCPGGWDEKNCAPDPVCLKNEFQCLNGECISKVWRCDGKHDCKDSSDESDCETTECDAGWLRCSTGSCAPSSYICDGHTFCTDVSDEKNCRTCENWGCSHFCNETFLKPQCYCPQGLELDPEDNRTCMGKCENWGCSHFCAETLNQPKCSCPEGFELDVEDKRTCKGYEDSEFIFYNEGSSIYMKKLTTVGVESTHLLPISIQLSRITALSFGVKSLNLFIADVDRPAIIAVKVSSLHAWGLVTDRIGSPVDIAFDWLSNNLYWIDSVNGSAEVISVATSKRTVLIKDLQSPLSLAISPHSGMMFIATKSFESSISLYGMDGKYKRILHSGYGSPLSLALHPSKSLLYWSDPSLGMISFVNYSSSSSPKILKMGISGIMSLTVSESDVFYTAEEPEAAESVHRLKVEGYDKNKKWKSITSSFGKKFSGKSECFINNGGCDYLCLTSELGRSCACSSEMALHEDGKSCLH